VRTSKQVTGAFPAWLDIAHFLNLLFLSLLARSGLQILGSFPRLYLADGCTPGSELIWFHRGRRSAKDVRTSLDEEVDMPAWLALPGGKALGLGRSWHFASLFGWVLTGAVYILLLFATGEWVRLVPTSPVIFAQALSVAGDYLHLRLPADLPGLPYNALQQLAYFAVVFLLAPFQIATGAAMSPAIIGAARWYARLFGGRQGARTLHFFGLLAFAVFVAVHTALVVVHGLSSGLAKIVLANAAADGRLAIAVGTGALALVLLVHVAGTVLSRRDPRRAERLLAPPAEILQRLLSTSLHSRQAYPPSAVSDFHWVNGVPPAGPDYQRNVELGFSEWELRVDGLVQTPLRLKLPELKAMPATSQVVKHNCIQGWSGVAEWTGVPLAQLLRRAQPLPCARFVVVWAAGDSAGEAPYYECLDLEMAIAPQCILAYLMNGETLPVAHGAPLRLRVENQLGYKMVKWVQRIEVVDDFRRFGQGQGGWREDRMHYSRLAGI
jgi:methionine sulfoxide reductase catalytic subunit